MYVRMCKSDHVSYFCLSPTPSHMYIYISECKSCFSLFLPHHILHMSECVRSRVLFLFLSHTTAYAFLHTRFEFLRQFCREYRSCGMWRRVTWCFLAFRGNAVPASSFEGSNKGSPLLRKVRRQCNIPEALNSCLIRVLLIVCVDGGVWDMKPSNTRRFWVRSTKSINLWLIITCILFLQGYSESSLPWTCHGYAVQIAFLSSRGRSVPFAVSHTDTCVYGSRPNVGRMQRHVMNVQPLSLLNKLGRACRVLHFWPIRPVVFPIVPESFQWSLNAVTTFVVFLLGMIIVLDRTLYFRSFWLRMVISRTLRGSRRRRCIIFLTLLSQMP
jgi:uncharacterized membrane protein YecN with MAPEG domain